jgi:hypothetical protein
MIDSKLVMSDKQAVTASAASTNVIDFGVANPGVADGKPVYVECTVDEAVTADGAGTVTFAVQDSADDSSFANIYTTAAIGKATLVKGYKVFRIALPAGTRRYVRCNYTVATGPLTAGKFTAYATPYPSMGV